MLGKRGPQRGLFEADTTYGAFVGRDSFDGWLASQRGELFRDEAFAGLYVLDNGRPSVPPSLLAVALVLQTYDGVSDAEAKQRADYDLRWKVALGVELDARPFAKSTLQEFRAQWILRQAQDARGASGDLSGEPGGGEAAGEVSDHDGGAAEAEGRAGHDEHPGAWGGEGDLQPAGGWDPSASSGRSWRGCWRRWRASHWRRGRRSTATGGTWARPA
jgi:hypothetical protein